eukprot:2928334-Pyramimonas_sp.AAC.1
MLRCAQACTSLKQGFHRLATRPSELSVVMPAGPESELAALDISLNLSSARCAVKDQTRCCAD